MKNAKGFTLIELLMVIALIAIVSTLAVNKVGAVREAAARKVSLANQKAAERAVEAYLAEDGKLNRLDSLVYASAADTPQGGGAAGEFDFGASLLYKGPTDDLSANVAEKNSGLMPDLLSALCIYRLTEAEVLALRRLGFKYVTQFTEYAHKDPGKTGADGAGYSSDTAARPNADGTVPAAKDGLDPLLSACLVRTVKPQMPVAAITPRNNKGRLIYQACGVELGITNSVPDGEDYMTYLLYDYSNSGSKAKQDVNAAGGVVIAFGLGENASIIGKTDAGLDSAPFATFVPRNYYSRYILLFRLKTAGSSQNSLIIPEFAGVIDCCGNTVRTAQEVIKNL